MLNEGQTTRTLQICARFNESITGVLQGSLRPGSSLWEISSRGMTDTMHRAQHFINAFYLHTAPPLLGTANNMPLDPHTALRVGDADIV